jgi:hypothetical protein
MTQSEKYLVTMEFEVSVLTFHESFNLLAKYVLCFVVFICVNNSFHSWNETRALKDHS